VKPILGITMGDAAGIGPELILKAFRFPELFERCRPLVVGSRAVMDLYQRLLDIQVPMCAVTSAEEAVYQPGTLDVLDLGLVDVDALSIGKVAAEPGNASVVYTQAAGRLALDGAIDAIVSAPLNKESMRLADYSFEGQTQILAELTGATRFGMILLLGHIRVMMLTTHTSLRKACEAVTREKVLSMIELAHDTLRTFGIPQPTIAVAGLNPHSGEGGLFGREDVDGSIPAIEAANARGIHAVGPIPADVVFVKARQGAYDLVLAMYHDQANMAAKLLGFGEVVTVLAGLPIIRTSVGHGTAFDIAGKGIADARNFVMAIEAAVELVLQQCAGPHPPDPLSQSWARGS
jgi:4-hydroxythreonine-4-phosphate dehydrogenase